MFLEFMGAAMTNARKSLARWTTTEEIQTSFSLMSGSNMFSMTSSLTADLMSPSSLMASEKFVENVSPASLLSSLNAMQSNPAQSNPRVRPPHPAKRSMDVSLRTGCFYPLMYFNPGDIFHGMPLVVANEQQAHTSCTVRIKELCV